MRPKGTKRVEKLTCSAVRARMRVTFNPILACRESTIIEKINERESAKWKLERKVFKKKTKDGQ